MKTTTTRRSLMAAAAAAAAPVASGQTLGKTSIKKKDAFYRPGNKPAANPPLYSEAIACGDFVFISGHGVAKGTVAEQTVEVLGQIDAALRAAGSRLENCVKANVYLKNLDDYKAMNEAYRGRFGDKPPVRTTVAVAGIPLEGCLVEIEVIAHR